MALDNLHLVDALGIEMTTGFAVLTIVDNWDWTDEYEHLIALQAKMNAYLAFISSGEIDEAYPPALGRRRVIDVIFRFSPPQTAIDFIAIASSVASSELDVAIRYRCKP